jgi:DNA-binding NarL/FixJ family response regulator
MNLTALNNSRKNCKETKQMKKKADATRDSTPNSKSKAVILLKAGKSAKEVAKQTKISITTINKYSLALRS